MNNPVCHFEIYGKDGQRLQDFYRKVFDWKVEVHADMGNYGMVSASGENQIGGGICQSPDGKAGIAFYIMVDDLQAYLEKVHASGGKTVVPPTKISDNIGHFAMFSDPEGNAIGLFKSARS